MPDKKQRKSRQEVPDPASSYGREKPEKESGMGRLDNNDAIPGDSADLMAQAVTNKQPQRQINADNERRDQRRTVPRPPEKADHSMKEEEPLGWDQAPMDMHKKRDQRHPRTGGKGGTPDAKDRSRSAG